MRLRDNLMLLALVLWTMFIIWLAGYPFNTDMSYQEWR